MARTISWAGRTLRSLGRLAPHLALALAAGCSQFGMLVGPDYAEPAADSAERWIDYSDPRLRSEEADLRAWWKVFGDAQLDQLMERAASGNLTLRSAAERVAAARSRLDLATGFLYPQRQRAEGGVEAIRRSQESADFLPGTDRSITEWDAGVGASWEIDFWGRIRRGIESADAELDATIADHDDVLVLLYAEVASRFVSYRTLQQRLAFLRENVVIQEGAYNIALDRYTAGAVSERDVHEARQVLEETRARIPVVERDLRRDNNALCLLTGTPPRDLGPELGDAPIPSVPPTLALGIPADLVRRRPDVRRAERIAAARCALIGIAEADYYPTFSIVGSIGVTAEHASDLNRSDALRSNIGPTFDWTIFDYGRTAANVAAFEADFRAAVLDYQESVLRAGAEAEDAVVTLLKAQETLGPQGAAVEAAARTVQIARDQYLQGAIDFSTVFLFAGTLTDEQDRLAVAQGESARALVDLYRALGGGWDDPPEAAAGELPPGDAQAAPQAGDEPAAAPAGSPP